MNHTLRLVSLFLVMLLCASARADEMQAADAARMLQEGVALYEAGKYDEAIAEFLVGRALLPLPAFAYAIGQAERKKGECKKAIEHYREYLKSTLTDPQRAAVQAQIDRCEEAIAAAKPAPVVTVFVPAPAPPPKPRWWRDRLGDALVGSGVAVAVAGAVILGLGEDPPGARSSYDSLTSARSENRWAVPAGAAILGAGVVVAIGGAVRWGLVGARKVPK